VRYQAALHPVFLKVCHCTPISGSVLIRYHQPTRRRIPSSNIDMQDLRDAFRSLVATPVVSIVAILSLALGIGANTAIFSILDSLILRALPVKEPQRLVMIDRGSWTNPIWEAIRDRQLPFDGATAWSPTRFNLAAGGQTEMVDGVWVSGRFFDVLGTPAILGRTFAPDDDRRGGGPDGPVAVISYSFWQRRFGGSADVIDKPVMVERVSYTIVGVTPPEFFGAEVGRKFDVAVPIGTEPLVRGRESSLDQRSYWWLNIMLRLNPGQDIAAATAALRGMQPQIREATMPQDWPEQHKKTYLSEAFTLVPAATGSSGLRRRYQQPLTAIMVVVALVLLIACANIANLLLARANARRHELSVRVALGASKVRIARQLLTESVLLSGVGALIGLLFARWGSRLLVRQLSSTTNTVFLDLGLDWRVLGFTALVATATATLFGVAPALRASRVQPNEALKEQGRGVAGERVGLGNLLVVMQVALSVILVVAAGLFVRTFSSLANVNLGFDHRPVLVANINAQRLQLDPSQRPELFERLRQAAANVPGVTSAALSVVTPVSGSTWNNVVEIPGAPARPERERLTNINLLSSSWFKTMGTRLIAGRDFTNHDVTGSASVAIVNEAFARKFFDSQNPLGRRVVQPGSPTRPAIDREIVGYVEDAVYRALREPVPPTMYLPLPQQPDPPSSMSVSVRAAGGSPALLTKSLAAALTGVNKDIAITFRLLSEQVNASLIQERIVAMLSGFFGGLALLLAGIGLYGVTSYAVSRRRTEIGIRMALGAAPSGVVRMVLRRVALLVCVGIMLGAGISVWASRFVTTLLYGLQPRDPATLGLAALVLSLIGAMAGWIPARRAARIDPARVLREG
jgi:putative ABC transport system permease protein